MGAMSSDLAGSGGQSSGAPQDAPDQGRQVSAVEHPPAVLLEGIRKSYGDVLAVAGVDLAIRPGEFFTLLGPSGSGKTTLLRLIAGFEWPDSGRVLLGGAEVTRRPPYERPVNTVFQDYALFPHMSVADNVGYGLAVRKVPRPERRRRVEQALELVRLTGLGGRRPAQLSGGQRQRVALARAVVNEPAVLLLDEPLGALDLKLRQEMQLFLKRTQRELGMTFLYVTHDQEEALTMSDRIAVLSSGRVEQVGTPVEVYEQPSTEFVAGFIGVSNVFQTGGRQLTVRPEKIRIATSEAETPRAATVFPGRVHDVIYVGMTTRYVVELDAGFELVAVRQNVQGARAAEDLAGARVLLWWPAGDAYPIGTGPEQAEATDRGEQT